MGSNSSLKHKLLSVKNSYDQREKLKAQYDDQYLPNKKKYDAQYLPLYEQIQGIIDGSSGLPELSDEEYKKYGINKSQENTENVIEGYWHKVIENSNFFNVSEDDAEVLKHLTKVNLVETDESFTVEFHFSPNSRFSNSVLTKQYIYDIEESLLKSVVCSEINWTSQEKKEEGAPSFFEHFKYDEKKDDLEDLEDEAGFIRENLIPFSMEYYLDFHLDEGADLLGDEDEPKDLVEDDE